MSGNGSESRSKGARVARYVLYAILAPLAVSLVSAASIAGYKHFTRAPDSTDVRLFAAPIVGQMTGRYGHLDEDRGECLVESQVDRGVPEAHKCLGDTFLYDPCWGYLDKKLVCVRNPWTDEATSFAVERWRLIRRNGTMATWAPGENPPKHAFPINRPSYRKSPPWALELSNGLRCVLTGGATYTVAGERASYFCGEGEDFEPEEEGGGWVIGVPDRASAVWTVSFLEKDSKEARGVGVHVAWY